MSFRFIHSADWQIAKPFANFPPALAGELIAARLAVIRRIAQIARANGASHVLVAGDVFDSDGIASLDLRRALEHLSGEADITWVFLPGNHDPARPGGLWDRIARIGVPANLRPCLSPEPLALAKDVFVLPAPLASKAPGYDPSEWMSDTPTPAGAVRIGLAHGSVQGFASEGEANVPIARDRAASARLDYLALGDWHGSKQIDARTWYSGTPEPDRFPDNEPGYVLAVTAAAGAPPVVERIQSAAFTWAKATGTVREFGDLASLEDRILKLAQDPQRLIVRLTLSGALTLSETLELSRWHERLAGRLRHLEVSSTALAVMVGDGDLSLFGSDSAMRQTAERLAELERDENNPDREIARIALQRLAALAAEVAGAAP